MNGEVAGTFIYNGVPQNGATAKLFKIVAFAAYADSTDEVENNPMAADDVILTVNTGGTFAAGDIIKIESEVLRVVEVSGNDLYVIRGYRGTTPASHVQNTQIDDETVTEPVQDTADPGAGDQQGSDITTAVSYGGDGAYRWTAVPEGEYYVMVEYDSHRCFQYVFVENNDPTMEQLILTKGDIVYHNGIRPTRLPIGTDDHYLKIATDVPNWEAGSQANHAATHQNGGADEISVAALSGELADNQPPKAHQSSHSPGGSDAHTRLVISETQVYNAAAPVAWTDLDLSGTIGSYATMVLLKVKGDGSEQTVAFRKNGDTDEFYDATPLMAMGVAIAQLVGEHTVHLVATDASGVIEWIAANTDTTTIDIIGYWQ
jgi:hypothetical protein